MYLLRVIISKYQSGSQRKEPVEPGRDRLVECGEGKEHYARNTNHKISLSIKAASYGVDMGLDALISRWEKCACPPSLGWQDAVIKGRRDGLVGNPIEE
jgi:hypothetical protein